MNIYNRFKQLANESLSIMIVPHTGESIRQIKFKKIIIFGFISIFTGLSISFMMLIGLTLDLNQRLDSKSNELKKLQAINVSQKMEIDKLTNRASQVTEKLSTLKELEVQVRNLVGLDTTNNQDSSKPISRSVIRSNAPKNPLETDIDLEVLASEMDKEMENLNILIDDVTGQLKILDSTPDKMPASGKITSKFGYRISPITGRRQFHTGIDIANIQGSKVLAAANGIVTFSGWNSGYGKTLIISHGNGYRSVYAHNKENLVKVGQRVTKGDVIGKMGSTGKSTGSHLHFEIHHNGRQVDPEKILN